MYLLWSTQLLFFSLPEKNKLSTDIGLVDKMIPIYQNSEITGYKFLINKQKYTAKWIEFDTAINEFNKLSHIPTLSIYYYERCKFFCKKYIYEVKNDEIIFLSYDFFKKNYQKEIDIKKKYFPWIFLSILLCAAANHLIYRRLKKTNR